MIPMLIVNMASGYVSMLLGAKGPNLAVVSACATATHALGEAARAIVHNDADIMIAGGSEAAITQMGYAGFCAMKAMSTRNSEPERASRPFDAQRDGFVMGEGAGVCILESLEHARKRHAKIYCEVVGYGITGDAYHMSAPAPEGEGAARSMAMALRHARLNPEQIDYINAHGTSTPVGDKCETQAIKKVFGAACEKAGSQFHEVDDRPFARRGGRGGNGGLCAGDSRRHRTPDDQLRESRSRVRPRLRAQQGPAD